jgi:hypothetical protein
MSTKCDAYWQGDLESALKAHPVLLLLLRLLSLHSL